MSALSSQRDLRSEGSFVSERRTDFSIVFDNISVAREKKIVLEGATGMIHSGRLTAIVSCCGTRGDYHLLSVLAGNEECSGSVVANGTPVVAPTFRQAAAYIDEDLTTMDDLTVQQNIEYSAKMRRSHSISETKSRVEKTMEVLNLDNLAGIEVRRCSTYDRRRVSVAKELVLNPTALFFDNPVQELATHDARQFLSIFRNVASSGNRMVVISMVQPRWALLDLVDDVILVEGTNVVFAGSTDLLLSTVTLGPEQTPEATINTLYRTAASPNASLVDAFARTTLNATVEREVSTFMQRCAQGEISFSPPISESQSPWASTKFMYLIQYGCVEVRNNIVMYALFTFALLVIAIVLAAIYSSQSGQSGMQNRVGIIFFLIASTFLHNILFVDHRRKAYVSFLRHRQHGYFGSATYLCYNTVTSAFTRFFNCSVFVIVVYSLANIESRWDFTSLRDLVAIVALTSFSTSLVVFLVCALARSSRIAHFALFGIYTFDIILAGIILNINTLPAAFQVLSYGSHIRLGYESALLTQFRGQSFGCVTPTLSNETASCYTGDQYLAFLGFEEDRKWKNVQIMTIMSAVSVVLIYLTMVIFRTPPSSR